MLHDVELAKEISAIRTRFLQRISVWLPEIEALRDELDVGLCSGTELQDLQRRVHKIAGSAGSFGFPEFGAAAAVLDKTLGDTIVSNDRAIAVAALLPTLNHFLFLARRLGPAHADFGLSLAQHAALFPVEPEWSLASAAHVAPPKVRSPHILIADDDELIRTYMIKGLAANGWTFSEAENGVDVTWFLQGTRHDPAKPMPDLIVLDVDMPEMDGFATLNWIKAQPEYEDIPVIFLTAKDEDIWMIRGFAYGALEYINKPIELPVLERILKSAMSRTEAG